MSRPPLGSALHIGGLSIPFYSILMMTAVALGLLLSTREEKRLRLPQDTVLNFALVSQRKISVYGAAIAADVCYLVAFAFDLVYNLIVTRRKKLRGNTAR